MSHTSDIPFFMHQYQCQGRFSTRFSKSTSNSSSSPPPHSPSPFSGKMVMWTTILLFMACVRTEGREMKGRPHDGYVDTSSHSSHQHFTNIPGMDNNKMTEYRTSMGTLFPSSTRGLFLTMNDMSHQQQQQQHHHPPSPSQLEAVTEISHLINWKSHLGLVQNYNDQQRQQQQQSRSLSDGSEEEETNPILPLYSSTEVKDMSVDPANNNKIDSVINEIRRRRKKGFSVISRFLVGSSPLTSSRKIGPGLQQRSQLLNENDSASSSSVVSSIQMRRSASALRPFRMRLRWG